ncbi:MAG: phosphoglycerate kinase [Patescibacteria group bacterium]|nr:phosphoglycerate kinase [Patescibacteria group bacterium]MDD4611023.1 phosphoglycerate kinase [Patescibacteria group bacterium]
MLIAEGNNKIRALNKAKNISKKTVLLRSDFNVPVSGGKIQDDYKIISSLPTIRYLLRYKCKVVILTHLSDTKKDKRKMKKREKSSTKIIAQRLSKLLNREVKYINDCIGEKAQGEARRLKPGEILMLEDVRRHSGEEENNPQFARELARLADVYVNDAFAVSHRNHASLSAIKKYLPAYAGLLLEKEVNSLDKVLYPKQPLITILGGAKIATKLPLIKNLGKKSFRLLIGGVMANNFLAARGFQVGKSMADKESIDIAKKLSYKNIILPVDAVISQDFQGKIVKVKKINDIEKNDIILDIGPETIRLFSHFIKKAQTIIWNGPMGMFENIHFKHGTIAIANYVSSRSRGKAYGVVGGGETIESLKLAKAEDEIDWVSTAGGAMLAYLGGEKMPGLEDIVK